MVDSITFRPFVVTSYRTVAADSACGKAKPHGFEPTDVIIIPKSAFTGMALANRTATTCEYTNSNGDTFAVTSKLPITVDFSELLGRLGDNTAGKTNLRNALKNFVRDFLPKLQVAGKYKQLIAELENLEHIKSCVDEMLKQDGLNFKPEFVAKVATHRLNIAVFDGAQAEMLKYQPSSMFDFGDTRAQAKISGAYGNTGRATSPGPEGDNNNSGNIFSYMRAHAGELGEEPYITTDKKRTSCLSERFRSYLASIDSDNTTRKRFGPRTSLSDLPYDMMFLVGLQFGQINVGTWNPFMVAAKKYLAFQTVGCEANTFFWQQTDGNIKAAYGAPGAYTFENNGARLSAAFDGLGNILGISGDNKDKFGEKCEVALCAYYAITQEILSRCSIENGNQAINDRTICTMKKILRLEGLESLEPMRIVTKNDGSTTYASTKAVASDARRSVIVSSSAEMFVSSLDKPRDYPPPIKVITEYADVHHGRIFGCHMFNVDFANADRNLPNIISGKKRYDAGCPFFKDEQREFLIMPRGLHATVTGILAWAPDSKGCNVVADAAPEGFVKLESQRDGGFKASTGTKGEIKAGGRHCWQVTFCLGKIEGLRNLVLEYVKNAASEEKSDAKIAALERLFSSGKCPIKAGSENDDNYANRLEESINKQIGNMAGGKDNKETNYTDLLLGTYINQLQALDFKNVYAKQ
ncbi:MAG: hypothetical protein LBI47_01960 [Puniceicoccales bacterium]|nr:hypothetical protein [Puniceicoccales bacterium]